jgi:hypothetical protein
MDKTDIASPHTVNVYYMPLSGSEFIRILIIAPMQQLLK